MRVLILGGAGMLGHKLWQVFRDRFDTWITVRSSYQQYSHYNLFDPGRTLGGIDAFNFDTVVRAIAEVQPDAVINCIGIIKQLPTANDPIVSLTVNSLFPHRLANLCAAANLRLIHFSTDCVFSGRKGMYTEDDISDAEDLYGRTKFLGEVSGPGSLTVRTSIIGRELATTSGLVEWFIGNRGGHVRGYSQAIYSGLTTLTLADIVAEILERRSTLTGVYQISSDPLDKYTLLCQLREAFGIQIAVDRYADVVIDRSLDSTRFRKSTGIIPLSWQSMISAMVADPTPYDAWRTSRRS